MLYTDSNNIGFTCSDISEDDIKDLCSLCKDWGFATCNRCDLYKGGQEFEHKRVAESGTLYRRNIENAGE